MGLDVIRFRGGVVDEELICPICTGVLEAPLQAPVIEIKNYGWRVIKN